MASQNILSAPQVSTLDQTKPINNLTSTDMQVDSFNPKTALPNELNQMRGNRQTLNLEPELTSKIPENELNLNLASDAILNQQPLSK